MTRLLETQWSWIDGLRTTPHALLARPALSLTRARADARSRDWADNPRPSLRDLRAAARSLADEGQTTFSTEDLMVRVGELGGRWSVLTLRELLNREAAASRGCLTRVREGVYRLRGASGAKAEPTDAVGAVLHALRVLASQGCGEVTRRDIEGALAATTEAGFSSRSVRAGLLALRQTDPPEVVRCEGHRYRLAGPDGP